ncbi:hypothetical protein AFEL58S_01998 [Afipia felis]
MSTPSKLREEAIAHFKASLTGFRDIGPHIGRYTIDDLKKMHRASPALRVGIVGATKPRRCASGELQIELTFAGVIVTRSGRAADADDEAIDLAVSVAAGLSDWVPATVVPTCQPASNIHLESVSNSETDQAELAVWAVLWSHTVRIGHDAIGAGIGAMPEAPANVTITVVNDGETTALGGDA